MTIGGLIIRVRTLAFRMRNPSVRIGRRFRLTSRLTIRGPGKVTIGDGATFDNATGHNNRLLTFDRSAAISIGDGCYLNGVEIASKQEISIGKQCILAECLIMDTDFHSVEINRNTSNAVVKTAGIRIGNNVWIANKVIILRGVSIGDNSVVGAGSVVTRSVPSNVIVAGNPAKIVRELSFEPGAKVRSSETSSSAVHS